MATTAKTNITDTHVPSVGHTTTTLVSSHNRGAMDWARQEAKDDHEPPVVKATGATAGTPGTWTPAGATPPASVAAIGSVTASPTTAWTTGEYVQTATAGAAGRATWTGTAWVGGVAP